MTIARPASLLVLGLALLGLSAWGKDEAKMSPLQMVLANTRPLARPLGQRHPVFLWTPNFPVKASDAKLEEALKALKARGICLYHRWGGNREQALKTYLRVGRRQKKLGMPIAVDATGIAHGFFSGDKALGHVDKDGNAFRDKSFFWQPGCPFAIESRIAAKAQTMTAYAKAYKDAGLTVAYWAGDWEFDGPNEWRQGWATAKRCTRCRGKLPAIDKDFAAFQEAAREVRSKLQKEGFVKPMQAVFPKVVIGNYAMNPHDGFRYYWDFYEEKAPGVPDIVVGAKYRDDHGFKARAWFKEFDLAGYNAAMPVVYTWYNLYSGFNFENREYRWFYGMLKEISAAGKHASAQTPVFPFLHWSTTNPPKQLPEGFVPLSEKMYRELLWHALLRGHDAFVMWSPGHETAKETKPVHQVFAESLRYNAFILKGTPVTFDVPGRAGTVVSALRLGNRVLVRRTDFTDFDKAVTITVGKAKLQVKRQENRCQVINLP